jgi:hypothetical protein
MNAIVSLSNYRENMQLAVFVATPMNVIKTVCSWMVLSFAAATGVILSLRMNALAKAC